MSRHPRHAARRSPSNVVESLENRRLLCGLSFDHLIPAPAFDWDVERAASARDGLGTNIVWSNRGQASDNFAATFGTSAAAARAVVDAALLQWQRVILDWNRSDGTSTLQVNISISGSGFGGAGAPSPAAPSDGRPRTGSLLSWA